MAKSVNQLRDDCNKYNQQIQIYQGQLNTLGEQISVLSYTLGNPEQLKAYRESVQKYNSISNKLQTTLNRLNNTCKQLSAKGVYNY